MAITLATIGTAYDLVGTAATTTATAFAAIGALGAKPSFPTVATTDASYNNVITTRATWDTNYAAAVLAYNNAVTAQKALEDSCIALMVPNEWLKMTTLANFGAVTTQYIGITNGSGSNGTGLDTVNSAKLFKIWTYPTLPTQTFPNI